MAFLYDDESKFSKAGKSLQESVKPIVEQMRDPFSVPDTAPISQNTPPKMPLKDPLAAIGGSAPAKKEVRKSIISNFRQTGNAPEISDKQAKKVEYILSDPSKMQQRLEKDSGISGAFAQALLGFLPTIAGAIFGGDEGGAAGAQIGLKAMEGYQSTLKDERKEALEQQKLQQNASQFSENLESLETREIFQQGSQDERLKLQIESQEKMAREEQASRERVDSAKAFQEGVKAQAEAGTGNLKAYMEDIRSFKAAPEFVAMQNAGDSYERFTAAYNDLPPGDARTFTLLHTFVKMHDPTSAVLTSEFDSAKDALAAFPQLYREGKIDVGLLNKFKAAIEGKGAPEEYLKGIKSAVDANIKGKAQSIKARVTDLFQLGDLYNIPHESRGKAIGENIVSKWSTYAGEGVSQKQRNTVRDRKLLETLRQIDKQNKGSK